MFPPVRMLGQLRLNSYKKLEVITGTNSFHNLYFHVQAEKSEKWAVMGSRHWEEISKEANDHRFSNLI